MCNVRNRHGKEKASDDIDLADGKTIRNLEDGKVYKYM